MGVRQTLLFFLMVLQQQVEQTGFTVLHILVMHPAMEQDMSFILLVVHTLQVMLKQQVQCVLLYFMIEMILTIT
jgi:hypothetical protein